MIIKVNNLIKGFIRNGRMKKYLYNIIIAKNYELKIFSFLDWKLLKIQHY